MSNEYDREKDLGVMRFEKTIREIPGIHGHPFLYNQKNLLTIRLPKSITKLGRGIFYDCKNLYYVNLVDLTRLYYLDFGVFENTAIKKYDFRNSKITSLIAASLCFDPSVVEECVLLPTSLKSMATDTFINHQRNEGFSKIKTLMTPTLDRYGVTYIEDVVTEHLIINKFDGLGDLHNFNGDVKIWVPDEFYDGYVEKYTNYVPDIYLSAAACQDIISRLRRYSEGVPEFPMN